MDNKIRVRLYDSEAILIGLTPKEHDKGRTQSKYTVSMEDWEVVLDQRAGNVTTNHSQPNDYQKDDNVLSAWSAEGKMMDIDQYCKFYNLPKESITSYKLVSHTGTPFYNIVFKENLIENAETEIDFDSIIKNYVERTPERFKVPEILDTTFDRLVYTDVHIGMTTNENGYSLYGGTWNEEAIEKSLKAMVAFVIQTQQSDVLIIDELGDFMDGWNGETTRKGHRLPQNMDNEKAFDVALNFKCKMVDMLLPHYMKITCHNICNDNHAGSFGYVVNSAFKKIMEAKYDQVEVVNYRKFIEHYTIGNNTFILTHGKDSKNLKFGFKPILDDKQIKKITDYMDIHFLSQKGKVIEFSKGDSHQDIFDNSTSDRFNYYNYPALSPSSEWVQTNFQRGKRGFYTFNYRADGSKTINPYSFPWE